MAGCRLTLLLSILAFQNQAAKVVPDGVVYTLPEMKRNVGDQAILPCDFFGAPFAVYWYKGENPSTELITWHKGNIYGPRFDDGKCNISSGYDLIIHRLLKEDEGRYVCKVSNYMGILLQNFTDLEILEVDIPSTTATSSIGSSPYTTLIPTNTSVQLPKSTSKWVGVTIGIIFAVVVAIAITGIYIYHRWGYRRDISIFQHNDHRPTIVENKGRSTDGRPSYPELWELTSFRKDDPEYLSQLAMVVDKLNKETADNQLQYQGVEGQRKIYDKLVKWRKSKDIKEEGQNLYEILVRSEMEEAAQYMKAYTTESKQLKKSEMDYIVAVLENAQEQKIRNLYDFLSIGNQEGKENQALLSGGLPEWRDKFTDINQYVTMSNALEDAGFQIQTSFFL